MRAISRLTCRRRGRERDFVAGRVAFVIIVDDEQVERGVVVERTAVNVMLVSAQLVTVCVTPPASLTLLVGQILTVPAPWVEPKFVPVIVMPA